MKNNLDERDSEGNLTAWALACHALADHGCDCGQDEPGSCLVCVCERALRAERARAEKIEASNRDAYAEIKRLRGEWDDEDKLRERLASEVAHITARAESAERERNKFRALLLLTAPAGFSPRTRK